MIEKFFQGIRLQWQCPQAHTMGTKDGSIIDDPIKKDDPPMIYDGIDAELGLGLPHVSSIGLSMGMQLKYAWLSYVHGHTSRRLLSAGDLFTGPMSGCLIVEWTDRGMRWVGHVGTVEENVALNTMVKKQIGIALPTQARGFYPDKEWGVSDIPPLLQKAQKVSKFARPVIFALVTTSGSFYSILMFHLGGKEWVIGGCKVVQPTNAALLRMDLLA